MGKQDNRVLIIGTGMEAKIAMDAFASDGSFVVCLIADREDNETTEVNDVSVLSWLEEDEVHKLLSKEDCLYFVAIGDISRREEVYQYALKYAKRPATEAKHSTSWVSDYAKLGQGNLLSAGVMIQANVKVEDHNHFHSGCTVEPDASIGSYCNFGSGVRIGANAVVEDGVFVGTGAVLHPGVKIGKGAMIGAGSVVLRDVKAGKKVFGNPAAEH
jgi:sugar O-acyltransferase (sialic acid O-acetyltransferase NeuD family)